MNALALFWVTDSKSERSAGLPPPGANATLDHPVYEMSSEMSSHHKGPPPSLGEMVSTNRRQSLHSWSPLMALDRGFRMLFVREPPPRETSTALDVEVRFSSIDPPIMINVGKYRSRSTPRRTSIYLLFAKVLKILRRRARPKLFSLPRMICVPKRGCR